MYLPSFDLKGRNAVITGATRGIGRAIALAFAEAGANVVLISRNQEELNKTKVEAEEFGVKVDTICNSVHQYKAIVEKMDEILGESSLDIFVNNAGMNIRSRAIDVTEEEWSEIVHTNMKSAFFLAQAAARRMVPNQHGKIINISSVGGAIALRTGVVYAMTKSALIQMTKNLAIELGSSNIHVNGIGPWYFPTSLTEKLLEDEQYVKEIIDRTPLNRLGKLEEAAGAAVFLASDASNYITGQTLMVDGGMTIYGF